MHSTATIHYHLHDAIAPLIKFHPDGIEGVTNPYAVVELTSDLIVFVNDKQQADALAAAFTEAAAHFAALVPSGTGWPVP